MLPNNSEPFIKPQIPKDNFWAYLITQKKLILIASVISAACFILLKYSFPYPDFFVDSSNYVLWALYKFNVAYRPTGYAYFLRFTHVISTNPGFTVFIQYLLFFISSLFCFFSTDYLFGLSEKSKHPLLIIIIINPLLIFQTNLISSDSLFCSLTVTWFTLCLWIIKKYNWSALILQLLFLYFSFEVRYTAMFFPLIAIAAFSFCTSKWSYKIIGIALTVSVFFYSVQRQKYLNEKETHAAVFSGFAGWQIANNALYCYKKINVDVNDLPSVYCQRIDFLVKHYIDSMAGPIDKPGAAFIWDNHSPLKAYCRSVEHYAQINYFVAWFAVSIPFNDYGWYIIRKFPKEFMRCYILPNTINYFYPDPETLTNYNVSNMPLPQETKEWFNLDIDHIESRFPDLQYHIIKIYPAISLLLNVVNVVAIFLFFFRALPIWRKIPRHVRGLFLTWSLFYFSFMAFTIFASAVNLRFMDPVFILGFIIPVILIKQVQTEENRQLI